MDNAFDYDAELSRYHQQLVAAMAVRPDDQVLDVGCGTGLTTREAAGRAVRGSAVGVDVSVEMIATARQLSKDVPNARFEQADVQTHPFPAGEFSLGVSRFGTMFFGDPEVAFSNIARALRPGARLVQLVWQESKYQEWVTVIREALTGAPPDPIEGGAFSLADPATAQGLLTAAGFIDMELTEVREPVYYGADAQTASDAIRGLGMAGDADDRAFDRLLAVLAEREQPDGVWFDSRAWIITAIKD
ncbi:methyltransferase domain-containing protein [Kribbella sp. NPDC051952]|uniref:class I SAM-dependent methyltransferase n=1 Tax=Kribbella sp. NPDC051952 TaxID=3154851 RepID=UPI003442B1B3